MKVQVGSLRPNPYRHIDKYPINREKVESLKLSINDTTFWDNILARKDGDYFQIAYGHHRLVALKELEIKIVDIPVRDLTNAQMLKIMANENMDDWKTTPAVIHETVLAAKEFIEKEIEQEWKVLSNVIQNLFENEHGYKISRGKGVGWQTILRFLNGNWKPWHIQQTLETLGDPELDREAVEEFPTLRQAQAFKAAVRSQKVPKERQRGYARELKEEGFRHIEPAIRERETSRFLGKKAHKKELPWVGAAIRDLAAEVGGWRVKLTQITDVLNDIEPKTLAPLASALERFCSEAEKIITRSTQ